MALALGVGAGSFCWALLTVLGLSALVARYAELLFSLKIAGGLYLLYLAWKAFRSAASTVDLEARSANMTSRRDAFLRGLTVQMTNPKAAFAWVAIVSLGMQPEAPGWVVAAIVIGTSTISLAAHLLYALAFSSPAMMRLYGKARRPIQALLGTFFALAGLRLLTHRI